METTPGRGIFATPYADMAIANLWTCKKNASLDHGTVIVVLVFLSVAIFFHSWRYLLRNAVQVLYLVSMGAK